MKRERERERKHGEFVFEGPEQIQISSACQGQSARVILLVLEKLYCAAAQEKAKQLEIKVPSRARRDPDRTPTPQPPSQGSKVLVGTQGSS